MDCTLKVYGGLSLLSFFTVVNIAPFAHRIGRGLLLPVLVVFVTALAVAWTSFPFSHDAPLKVFFQQRVEIALPQIPTLQVIKGTDYASGFPIPADTEVVRAVTKLTGLPRYIDKKLIPELPSSWGKDLNCSMVDSFRTGLLSCGWSTLR